jgi:hypothetical protein
LCLGASSTVGCSYATGSINYGEHPELRPVTLYSGRPNPIGEQIAPLEKLKEGKGECTDLAMLALTELLVDAKALGASGVKDVRFRARWHWTGSVVCRRSLTGKSVQVRGIAYKITDLR